LANPRAGIRGSLSGRGRSITAETPTLSPSADTAGHGLLDLLVYDEQAKFLRVYCNTGDGFRKGSAFRPLNRHGGLFGRWDIGSNYCEPQATWASGNHVFIGVPAKRTHNGANPPIRHRQALEGAASKLRKPLTHAILLISRIQQIQLVTASEHSFLRTTTIAGVHICRSPWVALTPDRIAARTGSRSRIPGSGRITSPLSAVGGMMYGDDGSRRVACFVFSGTSGHHSWRTGPWTETHNATVVATGDRAIQAQTWRVPTAYGRGGARASATTSRRRAGNRAWTGSRM
jgi:hypothetical protein